MNVRPHNVDVVIDLRSDKFKPDVDVTDCRVSAEPGFLDLDIEVPGLCLAIRASDPGELMAFLNRLAETVRNETMAAALDAADVANANRYFGGAMTAADADAHAAMLDETDLRR